MFMYAGPDQMTMNWKECLSFSDLTEDELEHLALHAEEMEPESRDLEYYLVLTPDGRLAIRTVLADDISLALKQGDVRRSGTLKQVLLRFMQLHSAKAS